MMRSAYLSLSLITLLGACGDDDGPLTPDMGGGGDSAIADTGAGMDGSTPVDAGGGPLDSGISTDTGVSTDTGISPEDTGVMPPVDSGMMGGTCNMIPGRYSVALNSGSPICSMVPLSECSVTEVNATTFTLDCGDGIGTDCNLAGCDCSGSATIMGFSGTIVADFEANTATVMALGQTCLFDLTRI